MSQSANTAHSITNNSYTISTGRTFDPKEDSQLTFDFLEPLEIKSIDVNQYNNMTGNSIPTLDTQMLTSLTTQSIQPLTTLQVGNFNSTSPNPNSYNYGLNAIGGINTIGTSGAQGSINLGQTIGIGQGIGSITNDPFITEKSVQQIIKKELAPILKRLAIIDDPSPEILEKFFALKEAYNHYKTIEGLLSSEIEKIKKTL